MAILLTYLRWPGIVIRASLYRRTSSFATRYESGIRVKVLLHPIYAA